MKFTKLSFLFISTLILGLSACKSSDDDNSGDPCSSSFDQTALFQNVADNIILPGFSALQSEMNELSADTERFTLAPNENTLIDLRSSFLAAYVSWQKVAPFNFGPAEEVFLRSSVNNFPLNLLATNANIETGEYDFDMPDNFDKGFPALDYLLYGLAGSDNEIIDIYKNDETSKFKNYLNEIVKDLKKRIDHTYNGWASDYKTTFINNKGTAAGTSLSLLINQLNENYELIKREKFGIPSGVLTFNSANPEKVEAFYSGASLALATAALEATQQLYLGNSNNGITGIGLDDYLIAVNAEKNGRSLNDLIKEQFTSAINTVKTMEGSLSDIASNDRQQVVDAYNEITKQLVNIKTDMPSVLCVSITYIDNPSDSD